jgi:maltoporin
VTPEQWVEIGDLINKNEKSLLKADLTIKEFEKTDNDELKATVKNIGDAWALPFSTLFKIKVDGNWESVGRDWVWTGLRVGYSVDTYSNEVSETGQIDCWAKVNPTGNVPESDYTNNVATDTFTFS